MLISNTLPQISAPQATNVAATQLAFLSAAATAASRPLTPVAVNAAAAASAYSPQLPQPRRQPTEQTATTPARDIAGRPGILPDPEFWRVPDRQVKAEAPPPQAARTTVETVQKTTAYIAQAVAQELPEAQEPPESPQPTLPGARKASALPGKKPGVGDSSGFGAYYVASQRSTEIGFPNSVEAFA